MFHIFKKAAQTRLVTIGYPQVSAGPPSTFVERQASSSPVGAMLVGRRSLSNWRDCSREIRRAAAGHGRLRTLHLLRRMRLTADCSGAVKITRDFELVFASVATS